ncbi:YfhO family protein [Furfurilactobacillus entadae]|uniref:YfhO family protein n=1 Tax=Furfurilactobacillus entadae TaxID=2922307 RepID=UPI0035EB865A
MMKFSFAQRSKGKLYGGYVLFFCLFFAVTYGVDLMFGYSLISTHDVLHQHVPIMLSYRQLLVDWLHHLAAGPTQWSWHIGLGADTVQTFSYYVIGDPFAYLSLLFKKSSLILGFQIISILRVFCAGLSFTYCASHLRLKNWSIWLGALVYLSSGFAIYASLFQPFFINALILLPLLIVAIEAVLQGRSAWGFGIVVYFAIAVNFYLAALLAVGGIVYLVLRWCELPQPFSKRNWRNLGRLAVSGLLGAVTTAWITVPELAALQASPRFDVPFASGMKFYSLQYYLSLPSALVGNVNVDPFWLNTLSVNMLLLVVIWTLLHHRQFPLVSRTMILAAVMALLPMFAATLNGATSPSNRWLFLMSLPMALMIATFSEQLGEMTLEDWLPILKWTGVVLILMLISAVIMQGTSTTLLPQLLFLVVYAGIFVAGTVRPALLKPRVLLSLVVVNIFVAFNFENTAYDIHQFLPRGEAATLINEPYGTAPSALASQPTLAAQAGETTPNAPSFYRSSNVSNFVTAGDSAAAEDNIIANNFLTTQSNTSSFYSLQNGALTQFSHDLLNNQRELNLPIQQFDDRTRVLNFLGVRDLYANSPLSSETNLPANYEPAYGETTRLNEGFYGQNGDVQVYQTTANFPLVYFQPHVISNQTYTAMDANEKEASLSAATAIADPSGLKQTTLTPQSVVIPYQMYDSQENLVSTSGLAHTNKNDAYTLYIPHAKQYAGMEVRALITDVTYNEPSLRDRIAIDKLSSGGLNGVLSSGSNQTDVHGTWDAFKRDVAVGSPNKAWRITITNGDVTNSLAQIPETNLSEFEPTTAGVLNLGWVGKHQLTNGMKLQLGQVGQYTFKLQLVGLPMASAYDKQVQQIQRNGLQQLKLGHNRVTGHVTTTQAGVLTSSIPYAKGWSATINGRPAKIIKTDRAFVGIKLLKAGHQQVVLTYHTPGLTVGALITGVMVVLLGLLASGLAVSRLIDRRSKGNE